MKMHYLILTAILLTPNTFAWVCPNNFNQIVAGDTTAQIETQCGKPASQKTTQKAPNVPQEWTYYVGIDQRGYAPPNAPMPQSSPSSSLKMTVAFVKDKAVNITMQAMSLSSTSICGPTISVGDNMQTIEAACGKPSFVQKQVSDQPDAIEVMEYKYDTTPPNTLIFENGILKERK